MGTGQCSLQDLARDVLARQDIDAARELVTRILDGEGGPPGQAPTDLGALLRRAGVLWGVHREIAAARVAVLHTPIFDCLADAYFDVIAAREIRRLPEQHAA